MGVPSGMEKKRCTSPPGHTALAHSNAATRTHAHYICVAGTTEDTSSLLSHLDVLKELDLRLVCLGPISTDRAEPQPPHPLTKQPVYNKMLISIQSCWQFDMGMVFHGEGLTSQAETIPTFSHSMGDDEDLRRHTANLPGTAGWFSPSVVGQSESQHSITQPLPPPPAPLPSTVSAGANLYPDSIGGYYWPLNSAFHHQHQAFKHCQQYQPGMNTFETSMFTNP
ncbi:unnamed protein product [Mesocestoides corti]|uniref:Uncharacterized protein n=1 Tax=Mesocestoides corti TaxID=53468 RepID=A0A0R3UII0_MESCO|nr:unnamed protein product [Mesocestoides corti]